MKSKVELIVLLMIFVSLVSCFEKKIYWSSKDFEAAIDSYCQYVDSVGFKNKFDYIHIKAEKHDSKVTFTVHLTGGAYRFLNESNEIIDFFPYKGHDILLIGDFPNEIANINKNKRIDITNDIIKRRYPEDYKRYLDNINLVGPLIYDYMTMILIFKEGKLISCKRQYY